MPPIRLKIETHPDLDQVALPYKEFRRVRISDFLKTLSEILHKHIVEAAPVRSGVGRGAIVVRKRTDLEWAVVLDRRIKGGGYMTAQHEGVPPSRINPILPKRPKYGLYWPGIKGGQPVAAVYNHPGLKALKFFDVGVEQSRGDIESAQNLIEAEIKTRLEG